MTTDARQSFFDLIRAIGEGRRTPDIRDKVKSLHLSVFKIHKDWSMGVITAENISVEEKNVVRSNFFIDFMSTTSTMSCFKMSKPRALLSGMVTFRLEVVPEILKVVTPAVFEEVCRIRRVPFLAMREEYVKRKLGGTTYYNKCTEDRRDIFHALHKFPWWKSDFKTESDMDYDCWTLEVVANYWLEYK